MIKLAVLFGGKSTEHNISVVSATSVISTLDKSKYDIYPVYIDRNGKYYKYTKNIKEIKVLRLDDEITQLEEIDNIFKYLEHFTLLFPILQLSKSITFI